MTGRRHGIVVDHADPPAPASRHEDLLGRQRVQDEGDPVGHPSCLSTRPGPV